MRKIAVAILILFCLTVTCATEVHIKSITIDGQSAYMLQVTGFAHQNNALQLKFKLSSALKQPIAIEQPTNSNNYVVKVGPVHDLKLAQELQKK